MADRKYTKGTASAEQNKFLFECFEQKMELQRARDLLNQKFGTSTVSRTTIDRWWRKFTEDNLQHKTPGGSRSRSSSVASSGSEKMEVDDAQSTSAQTRTIDDRKKTLATTTTSPLVPYPITPSELMSPFAKEGKFTFDMSAALPSEKVDPSITNEPEEPPIEYDPEDYTTMDDAFPVLGSMTQDVAGDLDIDFHNKEVSQQPRSLTTGRFETKDNCVMCNLPINDMVGYVQLACKHKMHWDKLYFDWVAQGEFQECPKGCKQQNFPHCTECKEKIGAGSWESGCYCNQTSKIHADALELKLQSNGGRCTSCLQPHPGFCQICHRLRWVENDAPIDKVFRHCCSSYADKTCWEESEEKKCPYGCSKYGPITVVDYTPVCGVQNATHISLPVSRGLIGGTSHGCTNLSELFDSLRMENWEDPLCVVCKKPPIPGLGKTHLPCGHWLHYKYNCFTKWLPVDFFNECLFWVKLDPLMRPTKIWVKCRPWRAFSPCPKCGVPRDIDPTPKCSVQGCNNLLWSGFRQLQLTCCTGVCHECHRLMLLKHHGFCSRGHLCPIFCILCGDFIAIMGEGDGAHNPGKDLNKLKESGKEDHKQHKLNYVKDHCRLLFEREEYVTLPCCKRAFHTNHLADWFDRFGRHCPGCGTTLEQTFSFSVLNGEYVDHGNKSLALIKGEQNIEYQGKQYPTFTESKPIVGYCFLCCIVIGYDSYAVHLKCCNIFFHLKHLDDWSKRVGQLCPNCGLTFGGRREGGNPDVQVWFVNRHDEFGEYEEGVVPRFVKGTVLPCCKRLITYLDLECSCSCSECMVDLDFDKLNPDPEQIEVVRCSYCNCAMAKKRDPVFLDCGHLIHYFCLYTWMLLSRGVFCESDYQINRNPRPFCFAFHQEGATSRMLSIPRFYNCVKCGYRQSLRYVFGYLSQHLCDWKTAQAIMKYRVDHLERPLHLPIGKKCFNICLKELTSEEGKLRTLCRLCAGDIDKEHPGTDICPHCLQQVHSSCVAIWQQTTNCKWCKDKCNPNFKGYWPTTIAIMAYRHKIGKPTSEWWCLPNAPNDCWLCGNEFDEQNPPNATQPCIECGARVHENCWEIWSTQTTTCRRCQGQSTSSALC